MPPCCRAFGPRAGTVGANYPRILPWLVPPASLRTFCSSLEYSHSLFFPGSRPIVSRSVPLCQRLTMVGSRLCSSDRLRHEDEASEKPRRQFPAKYRRKTPDLRGRPTPARPCRQEHDRARLVSRPQQGPPVIGIPRARAALDWKQVLDACPDDHRLVRHGEQ